MFALAPVVAVAGATLELTGYGSSIAFKSGSNKARLSASCDALTPMVSWISPTSYDASGDFDPPALTVEFLNVPPTCVDVPLSEPCAKHHDGIPPLFYCNYEGSNGMTHTGPFAAYRSPVLSEGTTIAIAVRVNCTWPAYSELITVGGYLGDGATMSVSMNISYLAPMNSASNNGRLIPQENTPGLDGSTLLVTGLKTPPVSPPSAPPPSPPSIPPPSSPAFDGTDCNGILASDPSAASGTYFVRPDGYSETFQVYCDMDQGGDGWTVISSYHYANRASHHTAIGLTDGPRNEDAFQWDDWRLSLDRINAIAATATRFQIRCDESFAVASAEGSADYFMSDLGLLTASGSGVSTDSSTSNPYNVDGHIRGYSLGSYAARVWQGGSYPWHIDGSDAGIPGSVSSEDNFGYWGNGDNSYTNTNHMCRGASDNGHTVFLLGNPTIYSSCKTLKAAKPNTPSGTYTINPSGTPFQVYCDMDQAGDGWTVISAYQYANRLDHNAAIGLSDAPRGTAFQWDDFRLSLGNINTIKSDSTRFQIRCGKTFAGSTNDYIIGDIPLMEIDASGQATLSNGANTYNIEGNIRGYAITNYAARVWQSTSYAWHVDASDAGIPNPASSEDVFGYWGNGNDASVNSAHQCFNGYTVFLLM